MPRAAIAVVVAAAVAVATAFSPPVAHFLPASTARGRRTTHLAAGPAANGGGDGDPESSANDREKGAFNLGADLRARLRALNLDPLAVRFSAVDDNGTPVGDGPKSDGPDTPPADPAEGSLAARMRALGLDPTLERFAASQRVAESSAKVVDGAELKRQYYEKFLLARMRARGAFGEDAAAAAAATPAALAVEAANLALQQTQEAAAINAAAAVEPASAAPVVHRSSRCRRGASAPGLRPREGAFSWGGAGSSLALALVSPAAEPSWCADSEVRHGRTAVAGLALCYYLSALQHTAAAAAAATASAAAASAAGWAEAMPDVAAAVAATPAAAEAAAAAARLEPAGGAWGSGGFFELPWAHGLSLADALAEQLQPLHERALSSSPQFDPVAAVSQALQALAEAAAGLELSRAQAVGLATLLAAALAAGELRSEAQRRQHAAQQPESGSWAAAAQRGTAGLSGGLTLKPVVPAGGRLAALLASLLDPKGGPSARPRRRGLEQFPAAFDSRGVASAGSGGVLAGLASGLRGRLAASELVHGRVAMLLWAPDLAHCAAQTVAHWSAQMGAATGAA